MKTSELTGAALDWAVAKGQGYFSTNGESPEYWSSPDGVKHFLAMREAAEHEVPWTHSSTDWAEGGPIIKREGISLLHKTHNGEWHATIHDPRGNLPGGLRILIRWHPNDPLIAAMRCYVASKLGDEIDVPEELA